MSSDSPIFATADNNKQISTSVIPSVVNTKDIDGNTTDCPLCEVQNLNREETATDIKVATVDTGREQIKESNDIPDAANLTALNLLLEKDACLLRSEKKMCDSAVIPKVNILDQKTDYSSSDEVIGFPIASNCGIAENKDDNVLQVATLDTISSNKVSVIAIKGMNTINVDEENIENIDATVLVTDFIESDSLAILDDVVGIRDFKDEEITDSYSGTICTYEVTATNIKEMNIDNVDEETIENIDATDLATDFIESDSLAAVSLDIIGIKVIKDEEITDVDSVKLPPNKYLSEDISQMKESRIDITISEVFNCETELITSMEGTRRIMHEKCDADIDDNERTPFHTVTQEIEPPLYSVMNTDNLSNATTSDVTEIVDEIGNLQDIAIEKIISDVLEELKIEIEAVLEEEDGVVLGKGTKNESDFGVNKNKQDDMKKGLDTNCDDDELGEKKDEETVKSVRIRKEFSTSSASVNIFASALARAAGVKRSDLQEQNSKKESLKIERNERGERDKIERIEKERLIKIAKELNEKKEKAKHEKERILKQDKYEKAEKEKQAKLLVKREEALKNMEPQSPKYGDFTDERPSKIMEYDGDIHSTDRSNSYIGGRNERSSNRISLHSSKNVPHVDTSSRSTPQPVRMSDSHRRSQHPKNMADIGSSVDKIAVKDSSYRGAYSQQGSSPMYKNNHKYSSRSEDNQNNDFNGKISIENKNFSKIHNHQEIQSETLSGKFHNLMDDNPSYVAKSMNMEKVEHENDYSTGKNYHDCIDIDDNNVGNGGDVDNKFERHRISANSGHVNDYSTANNNNHDNYNNRNNDNNHNNSNDYDSNYSNINDHSSRGNTNINNSNSNNNGRSSYSNAKNKIYSNTGRDVSSDDYSSLHSPTQSNNWEKKNGMGSSPSTSKINYGHFPNSGKDTKINNRSNDNYTTYQKSNSDHDSIHDNSDRNTYNIADHSSRNNVKISSVSKISTGHANDYSTNRNYIDTDYSRNNNDSTNHGSGSGNRTHSESSRTLGESNRTHGESNRTHGESNRTHGESNRTHGESNRTHGESNRTHGESNRTHGESNRTHGESNRTHGESNRTNAIISHSVIKSSVNSGHINDYSTAYNYNDNSNNYSNDNNQSSNSSISRSKHIDGKNGYSEDNASAHNNYSDRSSSNSTDKRSAVSTGHKNDYSTDIRMAGSQQHIDSQLNLTTTTSRQSSNYCSKNSNYDYGGNKDSSYTSDNAIKIRNDHARQHASSTSSKYYMSTDNSFSSERSKFAGTASTISAPKKVVNVTKSAPPNADTYAEFMSTIIAKKEKDKERDKIKKRSKNWADEDDSDDEN